MEKIASQMLDKLKTWVDENPELVKTTLLTSGLGAAAAATLTGKESEHERTSTRVKRRIRNALFGALAAGGSVGLLHYAGKNIANAKLKNAPTPEEKFDKAVDNATNTVGDALTSPLALTGAGVYGAKKGLSISLDKTNNRAARLTKSIMSGIEDVNKANVNRNDIINAANNAAKNAAKNAANSAKADLLYNLQGALGKKYKNVSAVIKILQNDFNDIINSANNAANNAANNVVNSTKVDLLDKLQGVLGTDPKDVKDAAKILKNSFNADVVRAYTNTLSPDAKKNMYKLLREAGFDFAENAPGNMKFSAKVLAKLKGLGRRNWRIGAGAALGTGTMAGLGALIGNLSED